MLPYIVSSIETAFSLPLLRRFNSEIVLGQVSFKQCAKVYNHMHQCGINHVQDSEQQVLLRGIVALHDY